MIDFSEPTGLPMTAVLHFVADAAGPGRLLERYVAAVLRGGEVPVRLRAQAGPKGRTGGMRGDG